MTSTLLQVRGFDPRTRDELKLRAPRRGQRLTAHVRDLLERPLWTRDAKLMAGAGSAARIDMV
ncbi:MAG: hypothetical protein U0Q10_06260 [Dermatophilaceae bacterium]